jgi:surface antigen
MRVRKQGLHRVSLLLALVAGLLACSSEEQKLFETAMAPVRATVAAEAELLALTQAAVLEQSYEAIVRTAAVELEATVKSELANQAADLLAPNATPSATPDAGGDAATGGTCTDQGIKPPTLLDRVVAFFMGKEVRAASASDLFTPGYCTAFVAGKRPDVALWIGDYPRSAYLWDDRAGANGGPHGVYVDSTPEVGDIAVWERGCDAADSADGHVAYVIGVGEEGKSFRVEEANWDRQKPDINVLSCMSFIHKPKAIDAGSGEGEPMETSPPETWWSALWRWIVSLFGKP